MLLEPVTSITDFILAAMAAGLAGGMFRRYRRTSAPREALWATGLGALAASTLVGSLVHGFSLGTFRPAAWFFIWCSAAVCYGCFVLAATFASWGDRPASRLAPLVLVLLGGLFWQTYAVADRLIIYEMVTLLVGTLLYLHAYQANGATRLLAVPLASVVLAVGGLLHLSGTSFTAIWHFNQNDVFHLAMILALPGYYIGADPSLLSRPLWIDDNGREVPPGLSAAESRTS